jgi:hypothetical protein
MNTNQFLELLQGVVCAGDEWKAVCPAHGDRSPSLSIGEGTDGRILVKCFAGCSVESICAKIGIRVADLFPDKPERKGHTEKTNPFDWNPCVAAFTGADTQRFAEWRGISVEFFKWLHTQGMLGLHKKRPAFPVHRDGRVIACHWRVNDDKWNYYPKGVKVAPLIFGGVRHAGIVLVFESQWDGFAIMDKLGWHTGSGLADTSVIITRGADNGKLIAGLPSKDAIVYAFKQNDTLKEEQKNPAGDKWLTDIVAHAGCKVLNVVTPAPHRSHL